MYDVSPSNKPFYLIIVGYIFVYWKNFSLKYADSHEKMLESISFEKNDYKIQRSNHLWEQYAKVPKISKFRARFSSSNPKLEPMVEVLGIFKPVSVDF